MVNIFVISDTHFGHDNIIRYCNRPFVDANHMNEMLIANWNDVVRPQDHVYHLGDVASSQAALNRVCPRLNGHKRLVLGNHDNHAPIRDYAEYFKKILMWRKFGDLILTHAPLHPLSFGKALVNVHGHIHEKPSPPGPYINACVEWNDYRPRELDWFHERGKQLAEPKVLGA